MTIKDLKNVIKDLPDTMDVVVSNVDGDIASHILAANTSMEYVPIDGSSGQVFNTTENNPSKVCCLTMVAANIDLTTSRSTKVK